MQLQITECKTENERYRLCHIAEAGEASSEHITQICILKRLSKDLAQIYSTRDLMSLGRTDKEIFIRITRRVGHHSLELGIPELGGSESAEVVAALGVKCRELAEIRLLRMSQINFRSRQTCALLRHIEHT